MTRNLLKVLEENTKPISKEELDKMLLEHHGQSRENASSDVTALDKVGLEALELHNQEQKK